jgi:hypothetical protein
MRTGARLLFVGVALLLAGCLNGPMYWTRVNATPQQFLADHHPCFDSALIGHGSEKAYKACMVQKGWIRTQGGGAEPPDVPYFRGPEDDEESRPGLGRRIRWPTRASDGVSDWIETGQHRSAQHASAAATLFRWGRPSPF